MPNGFHLSFLYSVLNLTISSIQILIIHLIILTSQLFLIQKIKINKQISDMNDSQEIPPKNQNKQENSKASIQTGQAQIQSGQAQIPAVQVAEQLPQHKIERLQKTIQRYNQFFKQSIQENFACSLTTDLLQDPIILSSGFSFSKINIQDYCISTRRFSCPITRIQFKEQQIMKPTINRCAKSFIEDWKLFSQRQKIQTLVRFTQKKDRLSIREYQEDHPNLGIVQLQQRLEHCHREVTMKDFVRVDWKYFKQMDLTDCKIGDNEIQQLLSNAKTSFSNLCSLNLSENCITQIKGITRLSKLRYLNLESNNLTIQTKNYLNKVTTSNKRLKIKFKN